MQEQPTTASGEDEIDEAANLVDVLFGLVIKRRQLSYEERLELRRRVSDRLRERVSDVDPDAWDKLDRRIDRMAANAARGAKLSSLECDIFLGLMLGSTVTEIADELGLRSVTVSDYTSKVIRKLGARNRTHAVARLAAVAFAKTTVE